MSEHLRINRYLASAGLGSRRACEDLVLGGVVQVNGKTVKDLTFRIHPGDRVSCHGKPIAVLESRTILMNKPPGYICSTRAEGGFKCVFDLLPADCRHLNYVGRLDAESEGLLLFTNDGDLAQTLTHPSRKVPKTYHATLQKNFDFSEAPRLLKGMRVENKPARFASIHHVRGTTVKIVLEQGLKRQIRVMLGYLGYDVKKLVRVQLGGLSLGTLPTGHLRPLTEGELNHLRSAPVMKPKKTTNRSAKSPARNPSRTKR